MTSSLAAELALRWTVNLAAISVFLQSVADLLSHREWRADGLRSWPIISTRWPGIKRRPQVRAVLDRLFNPPGILIIIALRLIAAPLLSVFALPSGIAIAALLWICVSNTLLRLRIHMVSGDQSFSQVVFLTLLLGVAAGYSPGVQIACLWFIALQACLAYFTNGFRKWNHPIWREGSALATLTAHPTLGQNRGNTWLQTHPRCGRFLTYTAMISLVAMPLVLITGPVGLIIGLSWALSFHLINAVLFRLGSFFWIFIAAFPAIIYCNTAVSNFWR